MVRKKVWAIVDSSPDIDGTVRPHFIGFGHFLWNRPPHLSGYTIATFETRERARKACRALIAARSRWKPNSKLRVHRAEVSVTDLGAD